MAAIVGDIIAGDDWTRRLLPDASEGWSDLPYHDEVPALETESAGRDLRGVVLHGCDLAGANLSDTRLDFATLTAVKFTSTQLLNCTFEGSRVTRSTSFDGADLSYSSFRDSRVQDSTFDGATMEEVDLCGARFENCGLRSARLNTVLLQEARFARLLLGFHRAHIRGDGISGRVVDDQTDEFVKLYLDEEADIWALQKERPLIAFLWRIVTNSGRSVGRLFAWAMGIWLLCGWLYAGLPVPSWASGSKWREFTTRVRPHIIRTSSPQVPIAGFAPYYFSAVTITTLGYGDIVPAPDDWKAQVLSPGEAVLGLFAWGCLVTILLQRIQRRSA